MFKIRNTERNNEKASDYETFSMLYLLGIRNDRDEIDLVLVDCFNDITGADEKVSKLWAIQSKGYKTNSPLKIGEHLATLYQNFLTDFPFANLILFLETVESQYVNDNRRNVFRFSNFTIQSKNKIRQGLLREYSRREIINIEDINEQSVTRFLDKVDFAICTKNKADHVKNLIAFKNKELRDEAFFIEIFNEIRSMQSVLKNTNVENTILLNPIDALAFNKHIYRNQIVTLLINRLVGIELFNNVSVPIDFVKYVQNENREDVKDIVQACNSSLCRTFFNKSNKVHIWRFLEITIKSILKNPQATVENILQEIPVDLRKKVNTLDEVGIKFFIARVKDGLL